MQRFLLTIAMISMPTCVLAADACSGSLARQAVDATLESARQKLRQDAAPPSLDKRQVGRVLVARPAPEPVDDDALRADLDQLAKLLRTTPGGACDEALRVRRKHGLS